ncbi:hypothetical protein KC364_g1387 [Hortaea werneckii]|nr:hypothetical protein KC350_g8464 [Hortaea werneckii]KAI7499711.1 hypothetical protein KC364_g1387 [Hortaea werneckii]
MAATNYSGPAKHIATTGEFFCNTVRVCDEAWRGARRSHGRDHGIESNFFREAQFSADGTSIVAQSEDHCLRTFVLPTDLLDEDKQPHTLQAFSTGPAAGNIHAFAMHPGFDLSNPSTTFVLSAVGDQPITMTNALDYSTVHASYPSVNPTTELYMPSNSLAFTRDGAISSLARKLYGSASMSCKGRISALAISGDGILAAGSTEREIALYDHEGHGECLTAFSVARQLDGEQVSGTGVFDVRNTLQRVSTLTGREANTTQKLGIDVVPTVDGSQVWAGGTDGVVRMWENPGLAAGDQKPQREMNLRKDPISSAIWHPRGWVFATSSGHRSPSSNLWFEDSSSEDDESDSASDSSSSVVGPAVPDNKLDVWVM